MLHSFLNVLKPNSVYKFYKVRVRIDLKQFQDKVILHEVKLLSVEYKKTVSNVSAFIWNREIAFVRKLKYTDLTTRSLTRFQNKLLGIDDEPGMGLGAGFPSYKAAAKMLMKGRTAVKHLTHVTSQTSDSRVPSNGKSGKETSSMDTEGLKSKPTVGNPFSKRSYSRVASFGSNAVSEQRPSSFKRKTPSPTQGNFTGVTAMYSHNDDRFASKNAPNSPGLFLKNGPNSPGLFPKFARRKDPSPSPANNRIGKGETNSGVPRKDALALRQGF